MKNYEDLSDQEKKEFEKMVVKICDILDTTVAQPTIKFLEQIIQAFSDIIEDNSTEDKLDLIE